MAKPLRMAGEVTSQVFGLVKSLVWLLGEIEEELKVSVNSIRLEKMKYEIKRLLKEYDIQR